MFIWPLHKLIPESIAADVIAKVISGGTALSGDEDVIQTDGGGRWEISFSGISLNTVPKQRIWSGWTSHLAGGARAVLVPVYSLPTGPRPANGNRLMRPSDILADDEVYPTSVTFAQPYIVAETVGAAVLRATQLIMLVTQGARIEAGMRFGIGNRAYKVERVTAATGYQATCTISPPLREAVADGTAVNFDWPVVQCRAVVGQNLTADMQWGRRGSVSIGFVEDFSEDPDGS